MPQLARKQKNKFARKLSWVFSYTSSTNSMRHCIYPGTFDPLTYGHLDVLKRAAHLFDKVTVAISDNPSKGPFFSAQERLELLQANIHDLKNVEACTFNNLLVEYAHQIGACAIIRGLRAISDFEFEFNMALMNRHLEPTIESIFLMPNEEFSFTSSTLVKQVAKYGGDISHFVPPNVALALSKAFRNT